MAVGTPEFMSREQMLGETVTGRSDQYALAVLAVLASVHATLTLPGIAGFVLSIGMAVDANVLIGITECRRVEKTRSLHGSAQRPFQWVEEEPNALRS